MRRFLGDAVLLFAGVGLGIATLFKNFYPGKPSLVGINGTLVFNLINFAGWTAAAVLLKVKRTEVAAWLATGVTVSTLGFYLVDAGYVARQGGH